MSYKEIATAVLDKCSLINELNKEISVLNNKTKELKKEVRSLMINNDLWKAKNDEFDVILRKPSERFDVNKFKKKFPDLAGIYIKTRIVQVEEDDFDKKEIKEKEEDAYKECVSKGTPALVIKEVK